MELQDKIRIVRKAKGFSQQELGDRLSKSTYGISRQAISDWESGASTPKLDNLRDLARTLNISFDALLDDKCNLSDSKTLSEVMSGTYKKGEGANLPYVNIDIMAHQRVGKILAFILIFFFVSLIFVIGVMIFGNISLTVDTTQTSVLGKLDAAIAALGATNEVVKNIAVYAVIVAGILPFIFLAGILYSKIPSSKMIGHFDAHALTVNNGSLTYFPRSNIADIYLGKKKGLDPLLIVITNNGKQVTLEHVINPQEIVNCFQELKQY